MFEGQLMVLFSINRETILKLLSQSSELTFYFLYGSSNPPETPNFAQTSSLQTAHEVGRVKVIKTIAESSHPENSTTAI